MTDDVRKVIYTTVLVFVVGVLIWISFIFINACGFSFTCNQGKPLVERTPIPTVGHAPIPAFVNQDTSGKCQVRAVDLLEAWVTAGASDTKTFTFNDVNGNACEGNFSQDVHPLFAEANIWYSGAASCDSCHSPDLGKTSAANLDLTTYAGITAGSQRQAADAKGNDILGGGDWQNSKLYETLVSGPEITGHPQASAVGSAVIFAGKSTSEASAAGTPEATPGVEIARPSNPGGPGAAVTMTGDAQSGAQIFATNCAPCHGSQGAAGVPNPGSDDGSVPVLNPIDPTLKDPNYQTFATNVDLFIQHGSTPAGPDPVIKMPAWGDSGTLNQQQIADLIAYVISLNP